MKRYALSIGLALFAAAGVVGFYAYVAWDRLPEYRLVTIEGNAAEAERVELSGTYSGRWRGEGVTVSTVGSKYDSRKSEYLDARHDVKSWFKRTIGMPELLEEHRSFMRGKGRPESLYKDEERLIYAMAVNGGLAQSALQFKVDSLDLKSGRTSSWKTPMDFSIADGSTVAVSDIQRLRDELHILAVHSPPWTRGFFQQSLHLYVLDLSRGELLRHKELSDELPVEKEQTMYRFDVVTTSIAPAASEYAVLRITEETYEPRKNSLEILHVTDRLYTYNYWTGELTKLASLPLSNNGDWNRLSYDVDGAKLLRLYQNAEKIELLEYELGAPQQEPNRIVLPAPQLGAQEIVNAYVRQGRVYVLYVAYGGATTVVVLNARDGSQLYKGEVRLDGKPDTVVTKDQLYLSNLQV